jgi:hypothetical protein
MHLFIACNKFWTMLQNKMHLLFDGPEGDTLRDIAILASVKLIADKFCDLP